MSLTIRNFTAPQIKVAFGVYTAQGKEKGKRGTITPVTPNTQKQSAKKGIPAMTSQHWEYTSTTSPSGKVRIQNKVFDINKENTKHNLFTTKHSH